MGSKLLSLYHPLRASQPFKAIQKLDLIAAFFFSGCSGHVELPYQGSKPLAQAWKYRVLTTGPPGKSHSSFLFIKTSSIIESLLSAFPHLVIYLDNVSKILNSF